MNKLISVIIPVYNAVDCLPFCMDCVTSQTYRDLEIILVDDGSTDGSSDLCDAWANKDTRIKVFHKANGGVSSARNKGLDACNGDYIGFVDADDRIEFTMYEKLARSIESDNSCDMACCGYYNYPMDTLVVKIAKGTRKVKPCSPEEAVFYIYEREGYFNAVWNKLFERSVIFKNQKPVCFNENYYIGEDEVWLAEVLARCEKVAFVPEPLYYWMPQKGSATRTGGLSDKQMTVLETKKAAMKTLPQTPKTRPLLEAAMYNDCHSYKVTAYCTRDGENYKLITDTIRPMKQSWRKSNKASRMNKIKVILLDTEMALRLPVSLVQVTSNMRRFGIKKQ